MWPGVVLIVGKSLLSLTLPVMIREGFNTPNSLIHICISVAPLIQSSVLSTSQTTLDHTV